MTYSTGPLRTAQTTLWHRHLQVPATSQRQCHVGDRPRRGQCGDALLVVQLYWQRRVSGRHTAGHTHEPPSDCAARGRACYRV